MKTGQKISSAFVLGAFALGLNAPVQAHVPGQGHEGHDLMTPFTGLIMKAYNPRTKGLCCNFKDAHANLREERYYADGILRYRVHVPDGQGRTRPLEIPPESVLSADVAAEQCEELKRKQPDSEEAKTCNVPSFNVLWFLEPGVNPYNSIYIGEDHVFCYLPVQHLR